MRNVWGAPSSRRGPKPTGNMGPGGPQNFMTPVRGDSNVLASQQAVQAASIQRTVAPASVSSLGPRFQCGKLGHFRRACPLLQSATGVPK